VKIAICIPVHSGAHPRFVESLSRMLVRTMSARLVDDRQKSIAPILETFVFSTSSIGYSRRRLADMALEWGANWLLWLDADQTFPPDTLLRLLGRRLSIVGVNIRRRSSPETVVPTAAIRKDGKLQPVWPQGDGVDQVEHLGMGICLTHADVFRKIGQPYFLEEITRDGIHAIGEDIMFCRKAAEAGYGAFVDNGLSREVGHMSEVELKFP
jgi:hypothetical protein